MIIDFLRSYLRLESPLPILIIVGVATALLFWRPMSKAARRLLVIFLAGFWLASTWLGASALVGVLSYGLSPIESPAEAEGADTIVVLGGGAITFSAGGAVIGQLSGSSALRALEAARVFKLIGAKRIIASGGITYTDRLIRPESQMLRDALIEAGVPAERIVQESKSRNTGEEAVILKPILEQMGASRFVLVTSPTHMRRSLAVFRLHGLQPIPSTSRIFSDYLSSPPLLFPTEASLYVSDMAVYDYAASIYYWWRR